MTQVYRILNDINWVNGCGDIHIRKGLVLVKYVNYSSLELGEDIELFCVVQDFCQVTVVI